MSQTEFNSKVFANEKFLLNKSNFWQCENVTLNKNRPLFNINCCTPIRMRQMLRALIPTLKKGLSYMSMLCVNITLFPMHGHKFVIFEINFLFLWCLKSYNAHNKLLILLGVCCFSFGFFFLRCRPPTVLEFWQIPFVRE